MISKISLKSSNTGITGHPGATYNSASGTISVPLRYIFSESREQETPARVFARAAGSEIAFGASFDKFDRHFGRIEHETASYWRGGDLFLYGRMHGECAVRSVRRVRRCVRSV